MWTGTKLVGMSLKLLGLQMQLGHAIGDFCPTPIADNTFIINVHGIHEVSLDYCGCADAPTQGQQLLAARLHPGKGTTNTVAFQLAHLQDAWSAPISMRPRSAKKTDAFELIRILFQIYVNHAPVLEEPQILFS
jgi:hypothetical protein